MRKMIRNRAIGGFVVMAAMALPFAAQARVVTVTTALRTYSGDGAYVVIYVTDGQGRVHSTLHIAGPKAKYHKHLSSWNRAAGAARRPLDGVTGASVGSGQVLKVSVDLADALIDAGYQVRVDSAVEKQRDVPSDVVVPLAKAVNGRSHPGAGYVQSLRVDL
jgi:hypothetical protein